LKSFNCGGYNMIPHITSGIDASSKDEDFHSMASAWLFNQLLSEKQEAKEITKKEIKSLYDDIKLMAEEVYLHESRICDMIFEKGGIRTVTKEDMLHFVRNRIDVVLTYLKAKLLFKDGQGVVSEWFYNQLSTFKYADFFSNSQVQYTRNWNKAKLKFVGEIA